MLVAMINWWIVKKKRLTIDETPSPDASSNFILSNGDYLTLSDGSLLEIVA